VGPTKASPRRKPKFKTPMDDPSHGVEATIIDLGLARMDGGEGVHWTPFDDEIFESEGDYQFDVYRMMEGGIGEEYRPITNVLVSFSTFWTDQTRWLINGFCDKWLHYLALKLLHAKRLKAPGVSRKPVTSTQSEYTERECYESLVDVEAMLGKCVKDIKKKKGKKAAADGAGTAFKNANDVVRYGADKGWVK